MTPLLVPALATAALVGLARPAAAGVNASWRMPPLSDAGVRMPASGFSIRQASMVWWAPERRYYAYTDIVPNDDPLFPDSYNSTVGIFVAEAGGGLAGWTYLGVALKRQGPTVWDATGAGTPAAIAVNSSRVLLAYSGRYKTGSGHSSLMVATASHPRGPFTRPAAPVPASIYPGKALQGNEDGEVFWRRPGDDPGHVTLMFETKDAPTASGLPCSAGHGYCTRAVHTQDGGVTWFGGEVLLTRSSVMEPLTAAWFRDGATGSDRLIYITDGGRSKDGPPLGPHNRTSWLDAYISQDGKNFVPAEPFVLEEYWQPHESACAPKSRSGCEQPVITFVTDEHDTPVAVSYVRMDNATGRPDGYTNWIYPFVKTDDKTSTFAVPIITKISHASFAVEGGSAGILVEGFGLAATYPGAAPNACRLKPRPGESAWRHVSGFLDDPRSVIELNATVVRANASCSPGCYSAPANRSCCFAVVRCDAPPAVIAPGPGSISVRNNVGWSDTAEAVVHPIDYVFLLDVAIGLRPYIHEQHGHLLLRCNASLLGRTVNVAATIPSVPSASWRWDSVRLNGSNVLEFALSGLPANINADLRIVVTAADGASSSMFGELSNVVKWRRFMRAAAAIAPGVEPVQVDHHRRGLLVNNEPFVGSGWYVGTNSMSKDWQRNVSASLEALALQAKLGDNQIMPYGLGWWPASEQLALLDGCARLGIKVMYPLAPLVGEEYHKTGDPAGPWFRDLDTAWDDPQWQADVRSNVSLVKDHPAILGYYICDDCCPFAPASQPIGNISKQALVYNLLKQLDPLHLTFGAIQCNDAWMWSDVETYLPPDAVDAPGAVIPLGHQPRLQLSLDVPLWEHYGDVLSDGPPRSLPSSANPFGVAWGENADASIRLGSWFEPIVNCHGLWYNGGFNDYPASPSATRSAMWLSILDADLPLQLTFLLMENSWVAPGALRDDGWLQTVAVQSWGAEARMLAPSFSPTFGTFPPEPHRYVTVEAAALLRRGVVSDSAPVRARAWREVCGPSTNSSGICVHIIVVNTAQDSAASFTLRLLLDQLRHEDRLSGSTETWAFPMDATALFETGGYNVTVDKDGLVSDFVGPGQTLIYELGCNGPRELEPGAGRTDALARPQPPWLSCANRRVFCIHGFINNVSGGPPAPNGGRCAQRKPSRTKTDDGRRTVIGCHECGWGDNWNQEDGWRHYNYSLLSQLNFHSAAGLQPNGSLLQAGINSAPSRSQCDISDTNATSAFAQIREECKAAGVRLVLSVAQPATTGVEMLAFLDDDEATARAIKEMTAMVAARQKLVSFFSTLRTAMRAVAPDATLTYPIDGFFNPSWSTRFASIPALAQAVDHVFLMCYDSIGLWGQPHPRAGANSPLFGGPSDYGYDIDWQVNKSLAAGMPPAQLVIGVPWYGREWPVFGKGTGERQREIRLTQPNLDPNVTCGEQTGLVRCPIGLFPGRQADVPGDARAQPISVVEGRNRSAQYAAVDSSWSAWDNATKTPYYNWRDHWGQWGLGSYEDARSLGAKYEYAKRRGVGIGIWAIDYPMGDEVEWQTLQIMQA